MSRLPVENERRLLEQVTRLNSLDEAADLLDEAARIFGDRFVVDRACKPFRELWVGYRYARFLKARAIVVGDCPDVFIETPNARLGFEITEAMERTRRRGDEYKSKPIGPQADDIDARAVEFLPALRASAQKKSRMSYGGSTGLLIYANMGLYGAYKERFEPKLHAATQTAAGAYEDVLMFWESKFYHLWSSGRRLPINACQ